MASGELPPVLALTGGAIILPLSLIISFYINFNFGLILSLYFILNIAYSFYLKNLVIIDVMVIASGFVLRAAGGAFVIEVPITPWFIICTALLALFLAISKRRQELVVSSIGEGNIGQY